MDEITVEESILASIKKKIGIADECVDFDIDIIMDINSAFMVLNQIGVGPEEGYRITDRTDTWDDYITEEDDLDAVKTYVYLKVKVVFDPPLNSAVLESYNQKIEEYEWRLSVKAES